MKKYVFAALGCLLSACTDHVKEDARPGNVASALVEDSAIVDQYKPSALPPRTLIFTYDDGPDAHTLEIAEYLHGQGIRATFFINGCRIVGSPNVCASTTQYPVSILGQIKSLGHRIANHTQEHYNLPDHLSSNGPAAVVNQIRSTQAIVDPFIRDGYFLLRPPYGGWSPDVANAVRMDPDIALPGMFKLTGPINWDVIGTGRGAAKDWECIEDGLTVEECADRYVAEIERVDSGRNESGILLIHDRPEAIPGNSYPLLLTKLLVQRLRPNYRFAPLDALPGLPGMLNALPPELRSAHFSTAEGWESTPSMWATIRYGDLNHDGRDDVCGRMPDGVKCALAQPGGQFGEWETWTHTAFTDVAGWAPVQYSTTLQLADVNGDHHADLCGRGPAGIVCALSNGANGFGAASVWSVGGDFSDAAGWGANVGYYGTIRLADLNQDGNADVCGRLGDGIHCALSDGFAFGNTYPALVSEFRDDQGWLGPEYSTTLALADVDGDQVADICGRGNLGMACARNTGYGMFGGVTWTSHTFGNIDNWYVSSSNYRSIHMRDVNRDGLADVCGRSAMGVACAFAVGDGSFNEYHYMINADFRDDQGWSPEEHGATLNLADINGDQCADFCGRADAGIYCALSPGYFQTRPGAP